LKEKEELAQNAAAAAALQENFRLYKLKKDTQKKCDALQKDIKVIEQNQDLRELHEQ